MVAAHQSCVLNPGWDISATSALSFGAGMSVQPFSNTQAFSPSSTKAGCDGGSGFAAGLLNGALLCGICAASCGARYPACPCVCTYHGFDPSSKVTAVKS